MLAKTYKKNRIIYPCMVQPKLNGVRALWLGNKLQSRSYGLEEGLVWCEDTLPEIHEALKPFENYYFDGELYVHGWSLQKVNSCARIKSVKPHRNSFKLQYHIFDLISDEPFFDRSEKLLALKDKLSHPLYLVETVFCHSENFGDLCYRRWKSEGFEGMMYRDLNAHYGFEHNCPRQDNRWSCLVKRKESLDMECECLGVVESDAFVNIKEPHIASLQLRTEEGVVFNASSGLTNYEKIEFYRNPPIGCLVRISYDSLSDGKRPLQPTVDVVYV